MDKLSIEGTAVRFPSIIVLQPLPRAADGKSLFIKKAADLPNHDDVVALVITPVARPFDMFQLR